MPYKVTAPPLYAQFLINDDGDIEGWSEGYWLDFSDYEACLNYALKTLWPARRGLLPDDSNLFAIRVSATNKKGDVYTKFPIIDPKNPPSWNIATGEEGKSMPNNLVLWLRQFTANNQVRAVRPLHGLPYNTLESGVKAREFFDSAEWKAQFAKFHAVMTGGKVFLVSELQIDPLPAPKTQIKSAITRMEAPRDMRYRKTGRPFGLLRGRV